MNATQSSTPPLQGRGKGWGTAKPRLAVLQDRAREMRNNPTEPEKRLWRSISNGRLGGHKFRRQAVIGECIVDFLCPHKALVVEVDGETHEPARDAIRDRALQRFGYRVVRFTNADVMTNVDGVLTTILVALEDAGDRWPAQPHPNPSPEGEGL